MRRLFASLLALALAAPAFATNIDDLRNTEIAFAKAFADRDKDKFFTFVSDDATFLGGGGTLHGKAQVIERWSRFFNGPEAPFSWTPERVSVSADGMLGVSTGPVHGADGAHGGDYVSMWRKQSDGTWKILFDSSGPGPAVLPASVPPHEEGFVAADDGTRLYYRKIGEGRDTIIAPLDFFLYPLLSQLSDRATVITYDMRSRGRSDKAKDPATLTIAQDVRDLEAVRGHFKVEKFIPVGFSYLGKMVVMYASAHPEHVTRVIQLGPAANDDLPPVDEKDFGAPGADTKKLQDLQASGAMEKTPKELCVAQWNVLRYALTGTPKGAARFDVKTGCDLENEWPVNVNRTFAVLGPTIAKTVLSGDDLKKVTMPVLIVHGTKDRNAPYVGGQAWAAALPNARLVPIDGGAHASWLDEPPVVFAAIRQFLRGE
jgi:pimeloyl-ACP methyl ester carboxylesterase/ketosteroid isomerase-like protein